jgi:hypothetical protein
MKFLQQWKHGLMPLETVKFSARKDLLDAFPNPSASNKFLPNYFAKLKPQSTNHPSSGTVKRCVPFLDALSMGYIIPLWCDVFVIASNGELKIDFPDNLPMESSLSPHGMEQVKDHPLSKKPYGNIPLKWHNPWTIETPRGWSVLITSPLNHLETRFKILDGVIDTDTYHNQINFPFIWTGNDGEFLIPRGTPLVQVIPFKRANTNCVIEEEDVNRQTSIKSRLGSVMRNAYRNFFWHKMRGSS